MDAAGFGAASDCFGPPNDGAGLRASGFFAPIPKGSDLAASNIDGPPNRDAGFEASGYFAPNPKADVGGFAAASGCFAPPNKELAGSLFLGSSFLGTYAPKRLDGFPDGFLSNKPPEGCPKALGAPGFFSDGSSFLPNKFLAGSVEGFEPNMLPVAG